MLTPPPRAFPSPTAHTASAAVSKSIDSPPLAPLVGEKTRPVGSDESGFEAAEASGSLLSGSATPSFLDDAELDTSGEAPSAADLAAADELLSGLGADDGGI